MSPIRERTPQIRIRISLCLGPVSEMLIQYPVHFTTERRGRERSEIRHHNSRSGKQFDGQCVRTKTRKYASQQFSRMLRKEPSRQKTSQQTKLSAERVSCK